MMSGNDFDEADKAYLDGLIQKHKLFDDHFDEADELPDFLDDETIGDSSSNPSPTSDASDNEEPETPEDFKAMWKSLDDIYLADILYDALLNDPEMPSELAEAMVSGPDHSPSPAVYDLITEVIEEHTATLPPHTLIKELKSGGYCMDTSVNGMRLRQKFDTLEQAALGLLYAKLKGITEKGNPDHVRENATRAFMNVFNYSEEYKNLYKNMQAHIQNHRNKNGVDIIDIIDKLVAKEQEAKGQQKNKSSKRPRRV
jgi:hypothetical protein